MRSNCLGTAKAPLQRRGLLQSHSSNEKRNPTWASRMRETKKILSILMHATRLPRKFGSQLLLDWIGP